LYLIKIVASFSSNLAIVRFNYNDQTRFEFNVRVLNTHNCWQVRVMEDLMPRFYFNLASKDAHIPDDSGKELKTLHDAHAHARKLIDKILFHVGHNDVEEIALQSRSSGSLTIPALSLRYSSMASSTKATRLGSLVRANTRNFQPTAEADPFLVGLFAVPEFSTTNWAAALHCAQCYQLALRPWESRQALGRQATEATPGAQQLMLSLPRPAVWLAN
jgi:uncharacterized protein DUF6894